MKKYNPSKIERKWQKFWEKEKIYQVDLKKAKKPYYNLMMFPYPSDEGLHVGNVYAFTGADIHGRFIRLQRYDIFEPIGFDAFGIHSENFAIKKGIHPRILIKKNTDNFRKQLKNLGCLFDWRKEIDTTKPEYYKWTQWFFLQLFKAGLAYRKKAPVDWCPSCKTVLADEQVISGKCERCNSEVIQQETEQWFFRITAYAEKLLENLKKIDWSERTKIAQRNWIGKSEGINIDFPIKNKNSFLKIFTKFPETIFGVTFMVVAPEHEIVSKFKSEISNYKEIEDYISKSRKKSELERTNLAKEKTGVQLKGIKAVNPINGEEIPVFVGDFVLPSVGTGAVMAVPGHDVRDFEFAQEFKLPVKRVIKSYQGDDSQIDKVEKVIEDGIVINSQFLNGLDAQKQAKEKIKNYLEEKKIGKRTITYRLRDWLISRQRYWGPPIPIVYCQNCGIVPVPEKDLPVLLPYVKNFRPKGTGKSPLASVEKFVKTKCPKCKGAAERETDVSDTFLDSSWYFFRYLSADLNNKSFDKKLTKKWLPVDMYIGGQEHAVLHLLYTRFITMVLKDLGYIDFEEPFKKFRAHGLITKAGVKMSKSKGNVVNPDDYYKKYGADALRMYLMFLGPFSEGGDWQDRGIIGIKRFLDKVWALKEKIKTGSENRNINILTQKTIKKATEDLENLRYNTTISGLMILVNEMAKGKNIPLKYFQSLLILLSPFAPYITEELWNQLKLKGSVHEQKWPKYYGKLIKEEKINLVIQINGKVRDIIEVDAGIAEKEAKKVALSREKIVKWIGSKEPKKIVFVPKRLINIVI